MRSTTLASAALLALALLLPACDPEDPEAAAGPPGETAELAFAECMREQGYDWPDPVYVDGVWDTHLEEEIDMEAPAFQAAESTCAEVREAAGEDPGAGRGPFDLEAQFEAHLEFAACMREQGIEFPDPVLDGDTISGPAGPVDGDDAAFDAARANCDDPDR